MSLEELKKILRDAGVAGCGGAGFPAYAKLSDKADTILLNCAECEPLLTLHRQVLAEFAFEILTALSLISETVGADSVIIALKKHYKEAINAVNAVLDKFPNCKMVYLPEVYPVGDEIISIYEATGRVVPPGELPISVGVTVYNVETALNIYRAVFENKPVTHKYVTIGGAVKNPMTVRVPLGTALSELISLAGGANEEEYEIISGGPMMGALVNPLDTVTKTTNGLLVFPKNHPVVESKKVKISISMKRAMGTCCQCRACTVTCTRNLLGHPIEPHAFMRSATSGDTKDLAPFLNTLACSGCGLCEMYSCPQGLSPRTLITEYKNGLRANGIKPPRDWQVKEPDAYRNMKMVPLSRLIARLGLTKYMSPALLAEKEVSPKTLRIRMKQSIGAPLYPVVSKGDKLTAGQVIAKADENALGLNLHVPTDCTVKDANEHFILLSLKA